MELYNNPLIPSTEDELWNSPDEIPGFEGLQLLVLSLCFEANSTEAQTLEKMMAACKLSPKDYSVLQMKEHTRLSWQTLQSCGVPRRILLLGVKPIQLGIQAILPLNTCQTFGEGQIIAGSSLHEIVAQASLKRALWDQGLKPCFGL